MIEQLCAAMLQAGMHEQDIGIMSPYRSQVRASADCHLVISTEQPKPCCTLAGGCASY